MAEQITQDITLPDEPPSSRDRVNFRPRADTFVAWMKTFATQIASLIPKINTALTWINTNVQNALTYSQTATEQAGIATTKASEASTSAVSALSSKEAAEAIFDSFDDKYLGAKAVAPTVDNDGEPLSTGALYFKATAPKGLYIYDAELDTWSSPTYIPTAHGSLSGRSDNDAHPMSAIIGLSEALADKQASLVSGTNIKTINNTSILGGGDISVTTPDATETVKGKVELATPAEVQGGIDNVRAITSAGMKAGLPSMLNASGSAPMYSVRAWASVAAATGATINASGNISSVTDNGVGDYTMNFNAAMPDAYYSVGGGATGIATQARAVTLLAAALASLPTLKTTIQCRVVFGGNGSGECGEFTFLAIR